MKIRSILVAEYIQKHSDKLETLAKKKYEETVSALTTEYESKVNGLISQWNTEKTEITASYENQISSLNGAYSAEKSELIDTYESRLVFPSILNIIDNCIIELQNYHPNITDLLYLTKKKEQKLYQLAIELASELNKYHFEDINQQIKILISIFQNEFVESKQHWNVLMQNCLDNCCNFNFNKLSEIKT
jgi:hypothetical protein